MQIFIGGAIVLLLGIVGLIAWWWSFVLILKGILPIMFIFAGGLAVYLSLDQFKAWFATKNKGGGKNAWDAKGAGTNADESAETPDVEALRKENEELKKKLSENKTEEVKEKVEEAVEKAKDAVKDAAADVKDAADDVKEEVKEAADDAKDATKGKK